MLMACDRLYILALIISLLDFAPRDLATRWPLISTTCISGWDAAICLTTIVPFLHHITDMRFIVEFHAFPSPLKCLQ